MKTSTLLGGLLAILSAACASNKTAPYADHWTAGSIGTSVGRHAFGYDRERDGDSYLVHQWRKKQDINLTLSRHLLNRNPDNPFQEPPKGWPPRRDPHSIVPDSWNYFHVESLVLGGVMLGWTGAFIPLPLDSILGTFDRGGPDEFWEGVNRTTYPIGLTVTGIVHEGLLPFPNEHGEHVRPRYPDHPQDLSSTTRDLDVSAAYNTIYTGPLGR